MNSRPVSRCNRNPFSTRAVRPGSIRFRFSSSTGPRQLVAQLLAQQGWGEIIGPHGSGKSSLLEALIPCLEEAGRRMAAFTLHQHQRSLPVSRADWNGWDEQTQVVVDGYEQLGWWSRWRLRRHCRSRRSGLLVTAHRPVGFPLLFRTHVTEQLAWELARDLLPDGCQVIQRVDVERCFRRHNGNLRETFFSLYDQYEEAKAFDL